MNAANVVRSKAVPGAHPAGSRCGAAGSRTARYGACRSLIIEVLGWFTRLLYTKRYEACGVPRSLS